jgi:hypothetical protein
VKIDSLTINLEAAAPDPEEMIADVERRLAEDTSNVNWKTALTLLKDSTYTFTNRDVAKYWGEEGFDIIWIGGRRYKTVAEYDSMQKALPEAERDGWFEQLLQRKNLKWKEKYKNDPRGGASKVLNTFLHKLPYLLFVSLPIFALFLKLLYIRRKSFYYADHGIFSIYHYIFTFILLMLVFAFGNLASLTGLDVFIVLNVFLFLSGGVYLYISMKKFYGQGHLKTILKFILLNIAGMIMLTVLFLVFVLFSVFEI